MELNELKDLKLSSIMRELNKGLNIDDVKSFLTIYKNIFDNELINNSKCPEQAALISSLMIFNDENKDLNIEKIIKNANTSNDHITTIGMYLINIIKFIINRMPSDKRANAILKLKNKISNFNINELSETDLPEYAAVGQAITFLKHTLFNQNPSYIKSIINVILANL